MVIYSGFFPLKIVSFYSYVKLPEGNSLGEFYGFWLNLVDISIVHECS